MLFNSILALTVASLAVALPAAEINSASNTANPNANATSALGLAPQQSSAARRHALRTFPASYESSNTMYSCDNGPAQCCNSLHPTSDQKTQQLYGQSLGNLLVSNDGTMVGANCDPISITGVSANSACKSTPVCCTGTKNNGLTVGCMPLNVN